MIPISRNGTGFNPVKVKLGKNRYHYSQKIKIIENWTLKTITKKNNII